MLTPTRFKGYNVVSKFLLTQIDTLLLNSCSMERHTSKEHKVKVVDLQELYNYAIRFPDLTCNSWLIM